MNRVTSFSNAQTKKFPQSQSQPPPPAKKERKNLKRERLPANPLRGFSTRSFLSSSGCSNGSSSGSTSGESSKDCHRSLLSHSFSSSSSSSSSCGVSNRSVRSTPLASEPLIRKKPKFMIEIKLKPTVTDKPILQKPQRCKIRPTIRLKPDKVSVFKKQASVTRELKLKDGGTMIRVDDSIAQMTPLSILGTGSDLVCRSNGEAMDNGYQDRTPPVQASVSPEIQFGSSMDLSMVSAKSQACYAAGHLLSGVSDKRKCKPKGILTVGQNGLVVGKAELLNEFDDISMMPLPVDASVQWLLSPCEEEKEHEKDKYDEGFSQFHQIVERVGHKTPSPLSDRTISSDLCNISSGRRNVSPMRRTSSSLSPNELSRFRRFMHLSSCDCVAELDPSSDHLKDDKPSSPLSIDTLRSENVIQTPDSNSSFDSYLEVLSSHSENQKKHDVGFDLDSLSMTFKSEGLSPRSQALSQEPSTSVFNFESLATSSVSVDLSQFQRGLLVDMRSCHEEEEESRKGDRDTDSELDMRYKKENGEGRGLVPWSVAESTSSDGGLIIWSDDTNWMECYKNNFIGK